MKHLHNSSYNKVSYENSSEVSKAS